MLKFLKQGITSLQDYINYKRLTHYNRMLWVGIPSLWFNVIFRGVDSYYKDSINSFVDKKTDLIEVVVLTTFIALLLGLVVITLELHIKKELRDQQGWILKRKKDVTEKILEIASITISLITVAVAANITSFFILKLLFSAINSGSYYQYGLLLLIIAISIILFRFSNILSKRLNKEIFYYQREQYQLTLVLDWMKATLLYLIAHQNGEDWLGEKIRSTFSRIDFKASLARLIEYPVELDFELEMPPIFRLTRHRFSKDNGKFDIFSFDGGSQNRRILFREKFEEK